MSLFLLKQIANRAYKQGDFTLSSGKKSAHYVNVKELLFDRKFIGYVGRHFAYHLESNYYNWNRPDFIGGMEIGAIPVTTSILHSISTLGPPICSDITRPYINGFVIRKKPKEYGTQLAIEGMIPSGNVVIVEDVITTGASTLKAIKTVEELGCSVKKIFCIVDREEYDENFAPYTNLIYSITTLKNIIEYRNKCQNG